MDAEGYLHWLADTDLDETDEKELTEAIESILVALGNDPSELDLDVDFAQKMLLALQPIQTAFESGKHPLPELNRFRRDFLWEPEPPEVVLERELREIAGGVVEARWATETYRTLEQAIERFLDGDDEETLWATVDHLEQIIGEAADSYRQTTILPKEVTLESVVTHHLLCEGIQEWQAGLQLLREDGDEEPDWNAVLKKAELGSRLLVAVQIYHGRLQSVLSTY